MIKKYKVIYFFLWALFSFLFMGIDYDTRSPFLPQLLGTMVAVALAVPACYIAAYRFTPNYLYKKRIVAFLVRVILLILLNTLLTYLVSLFFYHLMTGIPVFRSVAITIGIATVILFYDLMLIAVSCAIKIIADRFNMEERLYSIQREKIRAELNFLRSQVNPHFLFNMMNTIYFQIDSENPAARESLEKLSEMLRYQLYECTTDRIGIDREIEYIRNYVDMQSLRLEKGTDIRFTADKDLSGFAIAPLLILPVIENAFKHVSHHKIAGENKIHISLKQEGGDSLMVNISNTYEEVNGSRQLLPTGGLGVPNLQRRLDLLYPGRHEFFTEKKDQIYYTRLKINYHD